MTEHDSLALLELFEYDHQPDQYCLMLSDHHMVEVMDVFDACGQYGNGYGWEAVARSAVRTSAPDLTDRIRYDPEAGTFVAHSDDPAALKRLGVLLRAAFQDRSMLRRLIEAADPDWFD